MFVYIHELMSRYFADPEPEAEKDVGHVQEIKAQGSAGQGRDHEVVGHDTDQGRDHDHTDPGLVLSPNPRGNLMPIVTRLVLQAISCYCTLTSYLVRQFLINIHKQFT